MIILRLHKFRCWRSLELTFQPGQVYLLQGESGAGKSTVAWAIYWVLYGDLQNVTPAKEPKADTAVELILHKCNQNIRLVRQRPNKLWVVISSTTEGTQTESITYEGAAGQAIINDIFGSKELWQATAHLDPRGDNAFIRQSNPVKMNLLSTISFVDMDPLSILEKLDPYLVRLVTEYNSQLQLFQSTLAIYQTNHPNIDWSNLLTAEQAQELRSQLQNYKLEYDQGIRQQTEYSVKLHQQQDLQSRLNQIIIPDKPGDLLSEDLSQLNEYLNQVRILQRLRSQLINYQDLGYTRDDLIAAQQAAQLYQVNTNLVRNLGIGYSTEHLQVQIQSIQSVLEAQPELLKLRELQYQGQTLTNHMTQLQVQLDRLSTVKLPEIVSADIPVPDTSEYDNSELQRRVTQLSERKFALNNQLRILRASQDVLVCPHCQGSLRYQNQCIISAEHPPVDPQEIIKVTNDLAMIEKESQAIEQQIRFNSNQIAELNRRYTVAVRQEQLRVADLVNQRTKIQRELDSRLDLEAQLRSANEQYSLVIEKLGQIRPTSCQLLSERDISNLKSRLQQCLQIQIVEPPKLNPEIIEEFLHRQEQYREYQLLQQRYPELIEVSETKISSDIQRLIKYQQDHQSTLSTQNLLQQQLSQITLPAVPDIEVINQKITQLQNQLDLTERTQRAYLDYQHLSKIQTVVNTLSIKLGRTNDFKKFLVDSHADILQPVISEINRELNTIIANLFTQSIVINLEMYRLTKTTQQLRQEVNFHIDYKGCVSEGIKRLSDGEIDRVVIATNLSLFKSTYSPLLILDESVKMIGIDLKEKVIDMVRTIGPDRYAIVIGHDLVEGKFDYVYNMKSLGDNYNP